jgi:phenylacetate-CoA ligase
MELMQVFLQMLKTNLEFKTKKVIEKEQISRLKETVAYVSKKSPFYKKIIRIKHSDVKTLDDMRKLPITTKEDLQKNNSSFYCVPQKNIAEIVSTTGTTGEFVFIALTKNDLSRLALNEVYSFLCAGSTPNDKFHIAVTLDNLFMAGMAYYSGIVQLGATAYRVGMHNIKKHIFLIQKLKPTGIVTVPSFLLQLCQGIKEEGINPRSLSIRKALLVGESIRDKNFNLSGIGSLIEKQWNLELFSTYGNSETAISFCECKYHEGAHEHPDLIISEILDDKGDPVKDGEEGELVLTMLRQEGMPLLRYRTGDITFKIAKKCKCGRNSSRIGPILGRKAQMIKYKGTKLYPKVIENAITGIRGVNNYIIEISKGDDLSDRIIVKVGCDRQTEKMKDHIQSYIEAYARVTPEVEILTIGEVEMLRTENGHSRKPRTIIDRRIRETAGEACK